MVDLTRWRVKLWRGFSSAWCLLTAVPLPGAHAVVVDARLALRWFPVVGCMLGGLVLGCAYLTGTIATDWPGGAAFLAVSALALLTGCLHLDGLADWADAFWNVRDRQRTLDIMKDSRIGAFGVVALALVLLGKWVCLARLFAAGQEVWLVVALAAGRALQVSMAVRHPYARATGTGRLFVQGAMPRDAHIALGLAVLTGIVLRIPFTPLMSILIAAYFLIWGFGSWCEKRIDGITGDLLGAGGELSELLILFLAAALV